MPSNTSQSQHLTVDTSTGLRGQLLRRLSSSSKGSSSDRKNLLSSLTGGNKSPNRSPSPHAEMPPSSRYGESASSPGRRLSATSPRSPARSPARSPSATSDSSNPFTTSRTQPTRRPNNDPPPAYSPTPEPVVQPFNAALPSSSAPATLTATDDRYSSLALIDTVFLIDDSGSMAGGLWRQTQDALAAVLPVTTHYDANGVDVYFLNSPQQHSGIRTPAALIEIFQSVRPGGSTPTGQALSRILRPYVRKYVQTPEERRDAIKGMNIIVITDGSPTDDVESPILEAAQALDKVSAPLRQVGIQFFQVGSDPEATEALKDLDDNLGVNVRGVPGGVRDMVDTVAWDKESGLSGEGILKVVLGAVNRRLDRKAAK